MCRGPVVLRVVNKTAAPRALQLELQNADECWDGEMPHTWPQPDHTMRIISVCVIIRHVRLTACAPAFRLAYHAGGHTPRMHTHTHAHTKRVQKSARDSDENSLAIYECA